MNRITELSVEDSVLDLLKEQGYSLLQSKEQGAERETTSQVVLRGRLETAVDRLNPRIPSRVRHQALEQVISLPDEGNLIDINEKFFRMLAEGVREEYQRDGERVGVGVCLIDFENPRNNDFTVSRQFVVRENNNSLRADVVLFVNGLPVVVMELKNPVDDQATVEKAYNQLQNYQSMVPGLFCYNGVLVASDGFIAKAGCLTSDFSRFTAWKKTPREPSGAAAPQIETLVKELLRPDVLLDMIRHFTLFERSGRRNPDTGLTTILKEKKIAAYHQYYGVNRAVESVLRAAGYAESSVNSGQDALISRMNEHLDRFVLSDIEKPAHGDGKGGVVWHTQGSGKSLFMVFFVGKIVLALDNPTILVVTDRNDLDDQLFDTFAKSSQLLRQEPKQAENRQHLKELLRGVASGGVIFSTIQKFHPDEGNVYEQLSERKNIVVLVDEAHRTQYGFRGRIVEERDEEGSVTDQRTVYGFAKYMRDALPNATYIGFTGTPIENGDRSTPAVFGRYVDVYDIAQAVEDGVTVPIYYESRLAKIELSDEGRGLVREIDDDLEEHDINAVQGMKNKWTRLEALVGTPNRVGNVARDIVSHFEKRQKVFPGKGMIVTMSRRIAVELYDSIIENRPQWHSDDLDKGKIKVVITSHSSDKPGISRHRTTKEDRRLLAQRMKDMHDQLELVIVCDMWLTGFDVPGMHTMYIDKRMKGHSLIQAIARVDRVFRDKPGGLIVDYLGVAADLKKALSFYSDSGGRGDPVVVQEQAVRQMLEKLEVVEQMFHGFSYENYFVADTMGKLSVIEGAQNHVLGLDDGKKRYGREVTALSKAFAVAVPNERAMEAKEKVAFFQHVRARLVKLGRGSSGETDRSLETAVHQAIDEALVSDRIVDVFDAAGIGKPDISVLSEEFLLELKNHKHKNLALEVLKKLLNDEIRTRAEKNLIKGRSLMEMLENSIRRYQNGLLSTAEMIEELIQVSREIVSADKEAEDMNLTEEEYAFYAAVADNKSARELMGKEILRELAVALAEKVRTNATIDWTIMKRKRAELKLAVKRILRKYGYPPDMEKLATDNVIKQAERTAEDFASRQ